MLTTRRQLLRITAAALGTAALPTAWPAPPCRPELKALLDGIANDLLTHLPELGPYNGVAAAQDGGPLARRMDDWSPAALDRYRGALQRAAQQLAHVDCGTNSEALQLATARAILADGTRTDAIRYGRPNPLWFSGHVPYVVTPVAGPHIDTINIMLVQQSLASPTALDAWVQKLEGLGAGFDAVRAKIVADEALGCRPPKALIRKTLPILEAFLRGEASAHPLIAALRVRSAAAGLDPKIRSAAEKRATQALDRVVRPAFARLRAQVAAMEARGRDEAGVWAQPDGEALYAANVRALGDTPLKPQDIHQLGLEEIRRITAEMDSLLRANGYSQGTVSQRYKALSAEGRFLFGEGDAGRSRALEFARELIKNAEARYPSILPRDLYPRATLEVRRTPEATQDGAPVGYCDRPSLDGKTPGVFWLNLRDMSAITRVSLPTLTYHEAVPGHFTAGGIELLAAERGLLVSISSFNAFNEGWALYSERLMAELGAYEHDPFGNLGRLNDELFRAVRLVVDTGMHHLRWSRERAIAFMSETAGSAASEVVAEIERYMAWPAQALGYKLGQLRLTELREALQRRLGARFDLPAFHRAVLAQGNLPLDLVASRVQALG